jgi:NADH-quinone oxidoreductase subunit M
MLWMIQRVFYGNLGVVSEAIAPRDLNAREHTAMWPLIALFLIMGVASPYWMKTLDVNAVALSGTPAPPPDVVPTKVEAETYPKPTFVDPKLGAAALHQPQPATPEGRRY